MFVVVVFCQAGNWCLLNGIPATQGWVGCQPSRGYARAEGVYRVPGDIQGVNLMDYSSETASNIESAISLSV